MKKTFKVEGMSCVNCARTIEIALKRKDGIRDVEVSFELGRVKVDFDEDKIGEEEIVRTIDSLGYRVVEEEESGRDLLVLLLSGVSSLIIVLLMLYPVKGALYVQFLLSTLVQVIGGWKFYRGAYSSLSKGVAGMDVLVSLGTSGAYLYSLLALVGFIKGTPFFETNALLITFVRGGRFIEEKAKRRATQLLRNMLSAQHSEVVVVEGSKEIKKNVREIARGERVVYRSGDIVLLDGIVVKGSAYVSEAVLTGEPEPVLKREGDRIISGSVVEDGVVEVQVESSYESSYLSKIGALIDKALSDKPRIQRLADRVSHYFVQVVVLISLGTFFLWFKATSDIQTAVQFALAVLVISCPCAFGIATPLAITVGISKALKGGILIKRPSILELVHRIDTLVFDKTGTLTEGKFEVVRFELKVPGALDLAYTMEMRSNHPIAKAIREFARNRGAKEVQLEGCEEIRGKGIRCGEFFIGDAREANGNEKIVSLTQNGQVLAVFHLKDTLRSEAREVVEEIKKLRIKPVLLSGDRKENTERVAKLLGIEEFVAEVSPEEKREFVRRLQKEGRKVGMVGDGINDAPALAQADVSFAVAQGVDLSKQVGDVVLLGGIKVLPRAIRIGGSVSRKVKQNLFWAFIYNVIGIPVAAGLFSKYGIYLKPEVAGLMMALSSLSVVFNTLLMTRERS